MKEYKLIKHTGPSFHLWFPINSRINNSYFNLYHHVKNCDMIMSRIMKKRLKQNK